MTPRHKPWKTSIYTGAGPFAMAFDPMPLPCAAVGNPRSPVWNDWSCPAMPVGDASSLGSYRFAYVANFTQSYLQLIDLDNSVPARSGYTFEQVVFTFGLPTNPKGQ